MHPYNPQCPIVTACCQLMWIYCRRSPNHTVNMVYMGHTAKTTLACITRCIDCSNTHSEPIISSRRHSVDETAEWIRIWPHSKPIARYLLLRQSRQIIEKNKVGWQYRPSFSICRTECNSCDRMGGLDYGDCCPPLIFLSPYFYWFVSRCSGEDISLCWPCTVPNDTSMSFCCSSGFECCRICDKKWTDINFQNTYSLLPIEIISMTYLLRLSGYAYHRGWNISVSQSNHGPVAVFQRVCSVACHIYGLQHVRRWLLYMQ